VIATYNWVEALALVLATVRAQHDLPDEVVIADDGSRPETAEFIAREATSFPVPLRYTWHEDTGFRLATIRNKAMAAARADYIVQLDGDLLLHPAFVRSHRRFARPGWYVQGSRVMLNEAATARCFAAGGLAVGPWSRGLRNRVNAIHAPWLVPFLRGPADPADRTRGCNMAFWRDDIIAVNGYDEAIEGWGREDSELAARLLNAGVRRRNLKFAAVAWHLHHEGRSQEAFARNHAIFERTVRERRVRCERGISQYLHGAESPAGLADGARRSNPASPTDRRR
jgi:glycosyltransferase involved in cell wall biosynthesis